MAFGLAIWILFADNKHNFIYDRVPLCHCCCYDNNIKWRQRNGMPLQMISKIEFEFYCVNESVAHEQRWVFVADFRPHGNCHRTPNKRTPIQQTQYAIQGENKIRNSFGKLIN